MNNTLILNSAKSGWHRPRLQSLLGIVCLLIATGAETATGGSICPQAGAVLTATKISHSSGGFTGGLLNFNNFGSSVSCLGDLDGDGVPDVAVGAAGDNYGAVWILFLNADGTVKSHQKISETAGGFTGMLDNSDSFGEGVASLGDLDGDGVTDLAVGSPLDDDGGGTNEWANRGAVWILFLNANGTVRTHQKISDTQGGFTGVLVDFDNLGKDVASLGDVDGDGVIDLAAGAWTDQDGGGSTGAVWIIFLNVDGTVKAQQKISADEGGFSGQIGASDLFGIAVGAAGDLDADGVPDLLVGAIGDDDGGGDCGAVWILFLDASGSVKDWRKISNTSRGFAGSLEADDKFGSAVSSLGDLDGDGSVEIAVGAWTDGGWPSTVGAVWILSLDQCPAPTQGDLNGDGAVDATDLAVLLGAWGRAAGDLNGDGTTDAQDLAVLLGAWTG